MKKIITIIISIFMLILLCACNSTKDSNTDTSYSESMYTGTINKPIVIDSDTDETITLKDVTANLSESFIEVKSSNTVTIILEGNNNITTTGEEVKAITSEGDLIIKGDGSLYITADDTAIKSKNNLTVESGTFTLLTDGDGLRSNETLTINGGNITINAKEGIESTQVTINDGTINILSVDDGINASNKSDTKEPFIEINGGNIEIQMGPGDTDAIDSNGDLIINGGKIVINATFAFDFAGKAELNGGEVYVNREKISEITNSMDDNEDKE